MRHLFALHLTLVLILCILSSSEARATEKRPPNVVIFLVDDMGWTDLGCYGSEYYETPNVDRLAREGMKFTQGYAACAVCSPSRAALQTGRHPARLGVTDWIHHSSRHAKECAKTGVHVDGYEPAGKRKLLTPLNRPWLELGDVTIAELLKPLGYRSAHVGKWHLGPKGWFPEDQGYDENFGGFEVGQPPSYFDPYGNKRYPGIVGLPRLNKGEYLTDREAAEAVAFIERNVDRPFFLHLAHYAVHSPLQAKQEVIEKYEAKPVTTGQKVPVYAAMVESVDDAVGAVLDCLDRNGLAEDTLVFFTSDNGGAVHFPATDNAPLRKGKGYPYEGGLRVPFIVRWPGKVPAGEVSDEPVSGIDLFPTIAEATGARVPVEIELDGLSLLPLFGKEEYLPRNTLAWHFPHYWWGTNIQPYGVIRRGNLKVIEHYEDGRLEFYDLEVDPGETTDLYAERPAEARTLQGVLHKELRGLGARTAQPVPDVAWSDRADRVWIGPEYWANPMEDWRLSEGEIEVQRGGANRNVQLLTHQLGKQPGTFTTSATFTLVEEGARGGSVGFEIGIQSELDDYRSALIHGQGLGVGLTTDGELFIGDEYTSPITPPLEPGEPFVLGLHSVPKGEHQLLVLTLYTKEGRTIGPPHGGVDLAANQLVGNIALVNNHRGLEKPSARFRFADWEFSGTKLVRNDEHALGPILYATHTLSRGVLKMTAQMPPLGEDDAKVVRLEVQRDGEWKEVARQKIHEPSWTATLRVEDWDATVDTPYRLAYSFRDWRGVKSDHHFTGTVRREPIDRPLVVAGFTGNTDPAFPNELLVSNVEKHDPDVLFFSGDQIYEFVGGYGIHREPVDVAILNYLRKIYLWGWAFRDVMRDRITVAIPDDHDVYQGNIWGNGGNPISMREHQRGGYNMHKDFVDVVHRTQVGSLPDPFDPTPMKQGISVYFTDLLYGRVSFAVIADRMFKAGPRGLVESGSNRPDHVKDPAIDVGTLDVPDAPLLGKRQLEFLRHWAADWHGADLKVVLSQTIFANVANYHGGNQEFIIADLDSNGWPQSGRNRALHEIRRGFGFMFAGDQHLASIVQHGIDEHRDAGWSFCVPCLAGGSPGAGRPAAAGREVRNRPEAGLANTGDYLDGLLNRITVHAVGNPERKNRKPVLERLHDKASGYGLLRLDQAEGEITMECWKLLFDAADPQPGDQFPGWPMTVSYLENYGRTPVAFLPELRFESVDPIVQVRDEAGEVVYTLRVRGRSFRAPVFRRKAVHSVWVDEGSGALVQRWRGRAQR